MMAFWVTLILGVLVIVMGAVNMTGNISSLHWYRRQRVTEENRKPFGRLVGLGTVIVGASVVLYGVCFLLYETTQSDLPVLIGTPLMILGIIAGLVISFYAMKKYNKGIF